MPASAHAARSPSSAGRTAGTIRSSASTATGASSGSATCAMPRRPPSRARTCAGSCSRTSAGRAARSARSRSARTTGWHGWGEAVAVSFSIVTPCLNAEATIADTLASVRAQRYDALEHVVVDGGSTDGTLDILRAAEGPVLFISEPDRGLSDAMNKGITLARNDVVGWLNADDVYLRGALERVAAAFAR